MGFFRLSILAALLLSAIMPLRALAGHAIPPAQNVGDTQPTALTGTVTDQTGAVLAGAVVTVSDGKQFTQNATSDAKGIYRFASLPPGVYKITARLGGFKDFQTEGLTISGDEPASLDVSMEVAGTNSTVNVEAGGPSQVETENAQVSGTITQKELVSLGLNGRNFTQLIALTPGVSNQTGQDEAKVGITGSVRYSVNGGRVEYNSFDVDGGDLLNAGLNGNQSTLIVYPSLDALSEVRVLTSNYGAMYGGSASGTVLAETKSGTDQLHGNAYEFIRNEFFNSRNYFDETSKAPLYRRNDFGGTLGGPVYIPGIYNGKGRTYFFASEEFHLERTPVGPGGDKTSYNQAVPSIAEREGNFSDVCPFVTPGQGGAPGGLATFTRDKYPDCPGILTGFVNAPGSVCPGPTCATIPQFQTFPGNLVPMDPNAIAILGTNIIPAPNATTGCNSSIGSCFNAIASPNTYWREEIFKLDHNLSAKNKLSLRYIHDSWNTTAMTPEWGVVQNSFPTIQSQFNGPGISMLAHLTTTFSPSLLNEFVFNYTSDHITMNNVDSNGATWQRPSDLTIGYLFNNGFGDKVPGIVVGGSNAAYGGNGFAVDPGYLPWHHTNPTYSFRDDLSKVIGKHTLQSGVQVVFAQRNELNQAVGANTGDLQGLLSFSNISSFNSTGNAFADFLLARPNGNGGIKTFQQDSAQYNYYQRYTVIEPYVQDDWRMTPKITVNLGLRLSLFGLWHEKYNNVYNWVPSAFNKTLAANTSVDPFTGVLLDGPPSVCELPGADCNPIPLNLNNLDPRITNGLVKCGTNGVPDGCMNGKYVNPAPRIGVAWDPRGDGKTSVRAGYGIFFHHGLGNEANTGSLEGSAPNVLNMTQNKPFTWECIGGVGQGCAASGAYPLNVTAVPTQAVWPYVQQWNLSVQHEVSTHTVATIGYVGSKGTHLTTELQINQLQPVAAADNPFLPGMPITTAVCKGVATGDTVIGNTTITPTSPSYTNLEAACFGTPGINFPDPNSLRTFAPGFGRILSLQNVANSNYNGLQTTIRREQGPLTLGVAYTYSHSIDDSSDRSDTTLVNALDLASNRASSSFDERHLFNISYVYKLPKLSTGVFNWAHTNLDPNDTTVPPGSPSKFLQTAFDGWEVSGITSIQSGTPFSIINGGSANGISVLDNAGVANGTTAGSYPDVIGDPHARAPYQASNPQSIGPILGNPAAFAAPEGLTYGDAGRNFFNNPRRTNFDITFLKHFKITEASNLQFRAEIFNLFNHTQFRIYDSDLGNTGSNTINCYAGANNSAGDPSCLVGSAFLHPVDAHRARTMQFGLKYDF
jgi:hypothetical protein